MHSRFATAFTWHHFVKSRTSHDLHDLPQRFTGATARAFRQLSGPSRPRSRLTHCSKTTQKLTSPPTTEARFSPSSLLYNHMHACNSCTPLHELPTVPNTRSQDPCISRSVSKLCFETYSRHCHPLTKYCQYCTVTTFCHQLQQGVGGHMHCSRPLPPLCCEISLSTRGAQSALCKVPTVSFAQPLLPYAHATD
jgi:hypothetical protein